MNAHAWMARFARTIDTRLGITIARAVTAASATAVVACVPAGELSPFGKSCDNDTACGDGFVCSVEGVCAPSAVTDTGSGEGEGEGEGDPAGDPCDAPSVSRPDGVIIDGTADGALAGVQVIEGDLRIVGGAGGLQVFQSLCRVNGHVVVEETTTLATVSFPELREIGGDLRAVGNEGLRAIAFPKLTHVRGALRIGALTLVEAGGEGCEENQTDPCSVKVGNPQIATIDLPQLDTVGDALEIAGNPELTALALPVIHVGREVMVLRNIALESLAFPRLEDARRLVLIEENISLLSVDFPQLTEVLQSDGRDSAVVDYAYDFMENGSLWIWTGNFSGLDGTYQYQLIESLAFPKLQRVDGRIGLYDLVADTVSFPVLGSAGGLIVLGNYMTDDNGNVNSGIESLNFPALASLQGDEPDKSIYLEANKALLNADFGALQAVPETLTIRSHPKLTSLCGFSSLQSVGGLRIDDNTVLDSLAGLASVQMDGGDVTITDNPALPQCQVDAFIASATPGGTVQTGSNSSSMSSSCVVDNNSCE